MEKRAIVTRADDKIAVMSDITHPVIKMYADRCKAEFIILEDSKNLHMHYRILQLYDLFEKYDRILSLDTDILVMPDCPNLFELVPDTYDVATIFEDVGSRKEDRRNRIKKVQKKLGNIGWQKGYTNTGCSLYNKSCRDIFKFKNEDELWMDLGYDDVYLGYHINRLKLKVFELPCTFNFMSVFAEPSTGLSKADAHVLHYAGRGFYPFIPKTEQIRQDFFVIYDRFIRGAND